MQKHEWRMECRVDDPTYDWACPPRGGQALQPGFTLLEVVLVIGLLAVISAIAIPNFLREIRKEELPGSGEQLRSLLVLVRANAALDGKRYRVRFPDEDEKDSTGDDRQPLIEREDDPIEEPEVYHPVTYPWAVGATLLGKTWCAEIRLGRPTVESLKSRRSEVREAIAGAKEDLDPERPPLMIEMDGSCDWVTFVLTEAPRRTKLEQLEDHPRIEVILDGDTGLVWLQRAFHDEELDLFEEKGWPAVWGQDYLDPTEITEDRVLELHEFRIEKP
ncbi:MAG: prepilin-type N-terminal cleavage/methylation domain-containing protein [Planctomycetota bacterium]